MKMESGYYWVKEKGGEWSIIEYEKETNVVYFHGIDVPFGINSTLFRTQYEIGEKIEHD